jgi:hypothetical protein
MTTTSYVPSKAIHHVPPTPSSTIPLAGTSNVAIARCSALKLPSSFHLPCVYHSFDSYHYHKYLERTYNASLSPTLPGSLSLSYSYSYYKQL